VTSVADQPREASHCKTASVAVASAPTNAVETLLANTTNAGTRLVEKGAPLPGSVSFESEAWTSFYTAGETVRQLPKGSKNGANTEAEAPERPEDHRVNEETVANG
jgi:hypothetical protein